MADGLLGKLLGGAKNIGTGLMNIPTNIGQRYEAGELFGGGGVLGGLLGQEARKQAQKEAIMKMGLGLLGQGPSRTPISFGQSLAQGLLQGKQAYRQDLQGQLADTASLLSLAKANAPDYMTVKAPDGSEVLVDKKTGKVFNPFGEGAYGSPTDVADVTDYNPPEEDIFGQGSVTLQDLAGGDIAGFGADVFNTIFSAIGSVASPERSKAKAILQKVNTPIVTALAADLGKSGSKYIVQKAEQNVPQPSDGNVTFYNKSVALITSLENKKKYAQSVLRSASATKTEKANARQALSTVDSAIKFYSDIVANFEKDMTPTETGLSGARRRAFNRNSRNAQTDQGKSFDFSNTPSDEIKKSLGIE